MDGDFQLIHKMKLGDDRAIELFIHKYYSKILSYCHLHIHDFGDAEDMTQVTFEKFFRSLNQYQHYGKAINYLYVIAANSCKDYYKKKKESLIEDVDVQLTMDMDYVDHQLTIEMALNKLPKELKEVAILYFCQELKQKEIAQILQIGLPLVKYRTKKAKELLSSYLRKEK